MGASPGALTVDFSTTPSSSRSNRGLHLFLPHPIPHHPRTFGASQGIRREPNPPRQKKRRDLRAAAAVLHPHAPGFGVLRSFLVPPDPRRSRRPDQAVADPGGRIRSPSSLVPARFPSRGALGRPACCSRVFFRVGASCLDSSGGGAGGGSSLMLPARPPRIAAR